jgi:hypothetical protein
MWARLEVCMTALRKWFTLWESVIFFNGRKTLNLERQNAKRERGRRVTLENERALPAPGYKQHAVQSMDDGPHTFC